MSDKILPRVWVHTARLTSFESTPCFTDKAIENIKISVDYNFDYYVPHREYFDEIISTKELYQKKILDKDAEHNAILKARDEKVLDILQDIKSNMVIGRRENSLEALRLIDSLLASSNDDGGGGK